MNENPKEISQETLSALLDGELSADEQAAVLRQVCQNDYYREQLLHFSEVSRHLKNDQETLIDTSGILKKVSKSIENDQIKLKKFKYKLNKTNLFFGSALAASVAALALTVAPLIIESKVESLSPETFVMTPKLSAPSVSSMEVALGEKKFAQEGREKPLEKNRWIFLESNGQQLIDTISSVKGANDIKLNVLHENKLKN